MSHTKCKNCGHEDFEFVIEHESETKRRTLVDNFNIVQGEILISLEPWSSLKADEETSWMVMLINPYGRVYFSQNIDSDEELLKLLNHFLPDFIKSLRERKKIDGTINIEELRKELEV